MFFVSLSLFIKFLMSRNPMFYFALVTFVAGIVSAIYFFTEWLRRGRHRFFILYWALGLLLLYWFQIPVIIGLAGKKIVYASFNQLFLVSTPMTLLGYLLIYLGIRSVAQLPLSKKSYTLLILWFIASIIFYVGQYWGATAPTRLWLLAPIAFFFLPVQILNLHAIIAAYRRKELFVAASAKAGFIALSTQVFTALSRYSFFVYKVFVYPPEFAIVLIRFSAFYIFTQMLGILFLIIGFLLIYSGLARTGKLA